MKAAISEVLETMFFTLADFAETGAVENQGYLESRIGLLNAQRSLTLSFKLVEPFVRSVTSIFLAMDEQEVTREDLEDMMKELANMIGGSFLAKTPEHGWQLQIPAFVSHASPYDSSTPGLFMNSGGEHVGIVSYTCTDSQCRLGMESDETD